MYSSPIYIYISNQVGEERRYQKGGERYALDVSSATIHLLLDR